MNFEISESNFVLHNDETLKEAVIFEDGEEIYRSPYLEIYLGEDKKDPLFSFVRRTKEEEIKDNLGNTVVLVVTPNKGLFIGSNIFFFPLIKGEKIDKFLSSYNGKNFAHALLITDRSYYILEPQKATRIDILSLSFMKDIFFINETLDDYGFPDKRKITRFAKNGVKKFNLKIEYISSSYDKVSSFLPFKINNKRKPFKNIKRGGKKGGKSPKRNSKKSPKRISKKSPKRNSNPV